MAAKAANKSNFLYHVNKYYTAKSIHVHYYSIHVNLINIIPFSIIIQVEVMIFYFLLT